MKNLKHLYIDDIINEYKEPNSFLYELNFDDDVANFNWLDYSGNSGSNQESGFIIYAESKEKGDKIIKAIVHLAKLYGAKPRPKVSEDMFK